MKQSDLYFLMTNVYLLAAFLVDDPIKKICLIAVGMMFFIFTIFVGQRELKFLRMKLQHQKIALKKLKEIENNLKKGNKNGRK